MRINVLPSGQPQVEALILDSYALAEDQRDLFEEIVGKLARVEIVNPSPYPYGGITPTKEELFLWLKNIYQDQWEEVKEQIERFIELFGGLTPQVLQRLLVIIPFKNHKEEIITFDDFVKDFAEKIAEEGRKALDEKDVKLLKEFFILLKYVDRKEIKSFSWNGNSVLLADIVGFFKRSLPPAYQERGAEVIKELSKRFSPKLGVASVPVALMEVLVEVLPIEEATEEIPSRKDNAVDISRRKLLMSMAALGVVVGLGGLTLSSTSEKDFMKRLENAESWEEKVSVLKEVPDTVLKKLEVFADDTSKGLREWWESLTPEAQIDYLGMLNFASGVKTLINGSHINQIHYGLLGGLLGAKMLLPDSEESRHHLLEEVASVPKAFGIILGTTVVGESAQITKEEILKLPEEEQIALCMGLASVKSPLITTVGGASLVRDVFNEIVQKYTWEGSDKPDPELLSYMVSHVSNLSGFLLFGDPPFIALVNKYGFAEAMKWQVKTMWPMALYSLFYNTYKVNEYLLKCKYPEISVKERKWQALKSTAKGLSSQLGVLGGIVLESVLNAIDQFIPGSTPSAQREREKMKKMVRNAWDAATKQIYELANKAKGAKKDITITWKLEEVVKEKLHNARRLRTDPELSIPREHQSFPVGEDNERSARSLRKILEDLPALEDYPDIKSKVLAFYDEGKFEAAVCLLRQEAERRSDERLETIANTINLLTRRGPMIEFGDMTLSQRISDFERLKNAFGHNVADIINVFPFQALSVPFLLRGFKNLLGSVDRALENLPPEAREAGRKIALYVLLLMFSAVADNYVAAKIGLELMPDAPELVYIASIIGGSLTPMGNMANIALFDLGVNPLSNVPETLKHSVMTIAVGLAYGFAINFFELFDPPKEKMKKIPTKEAMINLFTTKQMAA